MHLNIKTKALEVEDVGDGALVCSMPFRHKYPD